MTSFVYRVIASGPQGFVKRGVLQANDLRDAVDVANEDARLWADEKGIPPTDVEVVAIRKGLDNV